MKFEALENEIAFKKPANSPELILPPAPPQPINTP